MATLHVFLLICAPFLVGFSAATDTISIGQSIRDSEALVSSGTRFKLCFFNPVNSSYRYVGIMYNNIPKMTVIWVANRERPLRDLNGTLKISGDGNLVILDGRNDLVWSSNISTSAANSTAQLLDSGNLVLRDNLSNQIIWESFQHASDSLMPKMKFFTDLNAKESNILTSWRSPSDPALGTYTAAIKPLDVPQWFVWKGERPRWRSGPWNGQMFTGIHGVANYYQNGLALTDDEPGTAVLTFSYTNASILSYFFLNASGFLKLIFWDYGVGDWMTIWTATGNECDAYGKCGPFGSCDAENNPICTCFHGFEPKRTDEWEAGNWTSGCVRKKLLQCQQNASAGGTEKEDGFLKLERVKLPDNFKWFNIIDPDCKVQCLNNCSCVAYIVEDGIGCLQWTESLLDVQKFYSGGSDLHIRLAQSELQQPGTKKDAKTIIITTSVLGFIAITVVAYCLWTLIVHRGNKPKKQLFPWIGSVSASKNSRESTLQSDILGVTLEEITLFKFEILSNATNQFDSANRLGQGGFGPVYRGKLPNGQEIAVKRLVGSSNQGLGEFMNEVEVISKLQHRNLVRILGCCVEREEKMIVYEYVPNGSLDAYIFDSQKQVFLDWNQRAAIIEGICRGLVYLHRDSRLRIIHRDLKASNVLLDEEMNPKISDFGTARIFGHKEDQADTTRVVGTYGYMAPEYALLGRFSEKTDVYSFGVLLLETLCGTKNNTFYHEEHELSLIPYVWKIWNEEDVSSLMQPRAYDPLLRNEIIRYVQVGLLCVQEVAKDRPNISVVLSMLSNEIAELPCPEKPSFAAKRRAAESESSEKFSSKSSSNKVTLTVIEGR